MALTLLGVSCIGTSCPGSCSPDRITVSPMVCWVPAVEMSVGVVGTSGDAFTVSELEDSIETVE